MNNRTFVWTIRTAEGHIIYQLDRPGTVDVWMMQDWPLQVIARGKKGLRLLCGSADMTGAVRTGKGASWPYTIPAEQLELA
jgi:hypothetical protein